MDPSKLSGLERMQATAAGNAPIAPMAETMGINVMEVEKGRVVFFAMADGRHLNPMGGVHGGFAATVLDSVTGCAVHTMLDVGVAYGTVDLNVKMMRPVPMNEKLTAEARVTHISRSIGISEATLKDASGRLLASGSATCFIKQPK